jgi:hypothetical protein
VRRTFRAVVDRQTWGDRREAVKNGTGSKGKGRFVIGSSRKRLAFLVAFSALMAVTVLIPANAEASSNCGTSGGL